MTSSTKNIIVSASSGTKSPKEVIKDLDKLNIKWTITEVGDLWIKSWQIAAKGYVTPEQAAIIRLKQQPRKQIDEIEWLSRNLESVRLSYANQWVAIYEKRIVAAATDLPNLMNQVSQFDKPFITFIPADEIVWEFAYGS